MGNNIFEFKEMTEEFARDICSWKYSGAYEMYSFDGDEEDYEQLLSGLYLPAVFCENGVLAGFIAVGPAAQVRCDTVDNIYDDESFTDFALGLRPQLCGLGKGYGDSLLKACVEFLHEEFPEDGIRLTVASDNLRAKHLYEKNGFSSVAVFDKQYKGKTVMFEIMIL